MTAASNTQDITLLAYNKRINGFGLKPFTQSLLRKPSFIRPTLGVIGWQDFTPWPM
jgi:hypothetical protein